MPIIKICKIHGELNADQVQITVWKNREKRNAIPEVLEQEKSRNKKYWETNKEKITKKRQQPEKLAIRRASYKRKISTYRDQCRKKQQVYRDQISAVYVRKVIQNGNKNIKLKEIPSALVDLKTTVMLLKRTIKKKAQEKLKENIDANK